jgi:peptidoglycan/xylan/chitin deacetylase (PgdA/CDA1 family)
VEHPEILLRAVREGHEIGNHSWSHPAFGKMRDESVRAELQKTDDAIRTAIGVRPVLMRPPYGSITARQKKWINSEFGYRIILWDVDPLDWKRPGSGCRDEPHRSGNAPWLDHSLARYPPRHDHGDARHVRSASGQRV